jgi:hypothetical protein
MYVDLQRFVLNLDNRTTLVPTTYQLNPQQEDPNQPTNGPTNSDTQVRSVVGCWVPPFS